jgi:lipid II:glycine glycyltransferase (peptidoglycan interpeptide bridge formation enzyme)
VVLSSYDAQVENVSRDEWCDLLQLFSDSSINQTWELGADKWGEKSLSHIAIYKDKEVVALAQVGLKKLPVINGGLATVYWGPMWRRKGSPIDHEVLDNAIAAMVEEYVAKRGFLLRIWPTGFEGLEEETINVLKRYGFVRNPNVSPYRTLILDLSPSLEELRKNLDSKWRNKLNKAERNALDLIEGTSEETYHIFSKLLHETLSRKKFQSGVDSERYRQIQNSLPEQLKMKIVVCTSAGEPVAATVFTAIGDTCTYLFGATGDKGLNSNGAYLIHWGAIKWLKEKGCQWYDLGGIDPIGNPGVYSFKAGIVGKTGKEVFHFGQFYLSGNLTGYLLNAFMNCMDVVKTQLRR